MNSERRHQLNENELAGVLDKLNHSIEPYSKTIALGVAAFFVAVLGYGVYSSTRSDNRSDATLQLIDASITGDTESLATIAAQYPKTSAAAWARLYQGGQQMGLGFSSLYTSRDEAETLLDDAVDAYKQAMELSNDAMIQSRAHYGLAQIAEARGNVEEAVQEYEAAMAVGESAAMIEEAKTRVASLSSPQAKEFLAWFQEQDFSPAEPSMPPSLPGAGELPDLPDLDLPPLDFPMDDATEADAEVTEEAEATEEPAMTEEVAETEAAAEEEAAEEAASEEAAEPAEEMKEEAAAEEASTEEAAKEEVPAEETVEAETPAEEAAAEKAPAAEEAPAADEPAVSDE
ncbi:putative transmembrane protein [Rhodopirellula islandica]|uniref:Transmembrane protein n=1 Tax=Rhodopirellula islandica TaxID=595434 RepID=A0A0J1BEW5_RHOIS|nr:tetratricopeptide repeat protein [Rhodopirellula islandica]KLU05137.1 putative transmembrane protein [Rhodopirellula islandica]